MPHTPLTPGSTHTPIGSGGGGTGGRPPSLSPTSTGNATATSTATANGPTVNTDNSIKKENGPPVHDATTSVDLPSDLNFDPAAVIEGEAQGQEGLNVSTYLENTQRADPSFQLCTSRYVTYW